MPESQSSKLRKKWPWDWEKEKLTDAVQVEIVENLYSYAKDVAYWYPTEQGWHYWYNGLETYCQVSRDYFVKVAKGGPDSLKPKLSKIAEEAFKLINMLMEWANQKYSLCFVTEPDKRFYNIPYSDEELYNKWDTVVQKLNLYMNSGNQEEKPAKTEQNRKRTIVSIIISLFIIFIFVLSLRFIPFTPFTWLKNHPNSYGLQGSIIFLIPCLIVGLFKPQSRKWCWGVGAIAFIVLLLSLMGGLADSNVN